MGYLTTVSVARDAMAASSSSVMSMARFIIVGSLVFRVGALGCTSESRFLRWRISPRWSTCQDFLAQMNLVLDIVRMPFGDMM